MALEKVCFSFDIVADQLDDIVMMRTRCMQGMETMHVMFNGYYVYLRMLEALMYTLMLAQTIAMYT